MHESEAGSSPEPLLIPANCLDFPKRGDAKNERDGIFQCINIPKRFETPNLFYGYGVEKGYVNPIYRTSNSEYGWYKPSPHTVPIRYFPQNHQFSSLLFQCGMYRNYGLNTMMDRTFV